MANQRTYIRIVRDACAFGFCVCCAVLCQFGTASAQSFQALGEAAEVTALSADGKTTVGTNATTDQAMLWNNREAVILGAGRTKDVSSDGSLTVGATDVEQPVIWNGDGAPEILGEVEGVATGISENGAVVVGHSGEGVSSKAFRWTRDGGVADISFLSGGLAGGGIFTLATDVSGDGQVVVGAGRKARGIEAIRWTEGDRGRGLGDLPGGAFHSQANAVSRDGAVVVGVSDTVAGPGAFRWTADEGMISLGQFRGEDYLSEAYAVSADGSIVVGTASNPDNNQAEAFIWNANDGMQSLEHVFRDHLDLDLPDWELFSATAISADGKTIAGDGSKGAWVAALGPSVLGDFSGNGGVNVVDLDMLSSAVAQASHQVEFDLNNDTKVNHADLSELLRMMGALPGDANGDGDVGFADFLTLSKNYGRAEASWSDGDFDSNATVDFADFNILSANFGRHNSEQAISVAEPSTGLSFVLGFVLLLRRRRR